MSSSDQSSRDVSPSTRVFMSGGAQETVLTVKDLQNQSSMDRWSKEVEQEVMQRVREKAAAKAKEVLAQAQQEAEQIRQNAQLEGFNQGIADAQAELQQAHQEMASSLGEALANVQNGRDAIWLTHRQDLIVLVQLAVERILNIELSQQRKDILSGFMDQAVESLDNLSSLNITVHPDDEPTIQEILAYAGQQYPQLQSWRVKTNQDMQPGGLLVESDHGMIDNTLEGRRAIIEPVLQQLELPLPEGMETSRNFDGEQQQPEQAHAPLHNEEEPQ